jgi:hypothetical protein
MLTATGAAEHHTRPQLQNRPAFRWPWEKNA